MNKLTLTLAQAQADPYNWVVRDRATPKWDRSTDRAVYVTRRVADKFVGSTQFTLEASNDTDLVAKINAHEGERSQRGIADPHK